MSRASAIDGGLFETGYNNLVPVFVFVDDSTV